MRATVPDTVGTVGSMGTIGTMGTSGVAGTARAPARVVFTSGFSHRYTSGVKQFEIEAATLRGVIKAMEARFPGIGDILEEETSVVIDGEMHEVVYTQPLKPGCEVFFLPRIEGG